MRLPITSAQLIILPARFSKDLGLQLHKIILKSFKSLFKTPTELMLTPEEDL